MDFPENLAELSITELQELAATVRTALAEMFAVETPTVEQADAAVALGTQADTVDAELAAREDAATRMSGLRDRFAAAPVEEAEAEAEVIAEAEAVVEAEAEAVEEEPVVEAAVVTPPAAASARPNTAALAGRRPANVAPARGSVRLTAGSDVPGINTGGDIRDLTHLSELAMEKAATFPIPNGNGGPQDLRGFSLATIRKPMPDDLKITSGMSESAIAEVFARATDESRLPGGNLVASAGWCTPSEVAYDLCEGETAEGMLSIPEVELPRGGIKYTMGPDWSDITGQGEFAMTEAQAIAGSYTKPSFEIPCPTWTESRLDAAGLFVKVPLLLESAYPELVARWMRGIMTSHMHVMNTKFIGGVVTALGTAETFPGLNMYSAAMSLFDIIAFVAERERTKRKWAFNQALELVLPHWMLEALRADLANRTGRTGINVTDAEILAEFTLRKYAVQWVYDWQELGASAKFYPSTVNVAIYKAGTFVKGTKDVITLQSVYDAASLASNIYTGLFTEEGWNVMRMCPGGVLATVPLSIAGRSGAADVRNDGVDADPATPPSTPAATT